MTKVLLSLIMIFGLTCCQDGKGYDTPQATDEEMDDAALQRSSNSYSKHDVLSQRIATIRNSRSAARRR